MSVPSELSFNEILKFMLEHNGKVTNHDLVKYFRIFLTNPETRDEARSTFKKHVNALASIKNQNNEKWLILKRKYMPASNDSSSETIDTKMIEVPDVAGSNKTVETECITAEPPQYRPPPPVVSPRQEATEYNTEIIKSHYSPRTSVDSSTENDVKEISPIMEVEDVQPKLYPRRKSHNSTNSIEQRSSSSSTPVDSMTSVNNMSSSSQNLASASSVTSLGDPDQTVSVKERKQMFNKMASEMDVLRPRQYANRISAHGIDEEDRASVISKGDIEPLDAKQKQWILCAARGDYQALAKMCHDNPKLCRTKDSFTTAMHWACKRGDEDMVKMLAGIARNVINERSGYTPLHLAMQFRHENIYKLLIETYDADSNIRDWSGRKPRQYLANMDTALSPDAYRKFKVKSDKKNFEKEGFLRIGSLNVRVKKTTEAFSNFLGVGATRSSAYVPKSARLDGPIHETDQLHKNWGSAGNISDDKLMPPPPSSKIRKRGTSGRRSVAAHCSRSTPSTPDQTRAHIGLSQDGDSDSDTAAGFHDAWKAHRNSNIN